MVALSGGVDSAVSAALLLAQGFQVEAAFMKNWSKTTGLLHSECPWLEDRRDALRVAAYLGIPLRTFDFEREYSDKVMNYFFEEYAAGRTPNPDVMCNKEIKFKLLYNAAMVAGFDYLATGHYAQIKLAAKTSKFAKKNSGTAKLIRSKDEFKDQTYFIYNLGAEQLDHILFPIGGYKKTEVRTLAKKLKLPNAERKESMGICFVGKIRLEEFLRQKLAAKPGNIVDKNGKVLGRHEGTSFYTLGQRHGLNIGGGPYYVVGKDIASNTIMVSLNPKDKRLEVSKIQVEAIHWIDKPKKFPVKLKARFRHQQKLLEVTLKEINGQLIAKFSKPQHAIASGQSIVFYKGKECLGGGVIQ
jgi:tRNA-specific 2-thiouridylase